MNKIRILIKRYFHRLNTGMPAPQPEAPSFEFASRERKTSPLINLLLLVTTFFTTTLAGAHSGTTMIDYLMSGLSYSLTIMTILLFHEMGHYFAARKFGIASTLPYFIPIYIPEIIHFGTMGAVIKTKSPIPNRKALLYVGAMGPLPGFIISLAAVIYGLSVSKVIPIPVPQPNTVIPIFGDSLLFKGLVYCVHGAIPSGHDIQLSSFAWAGWIGFLITSLNLMPLGQLDGSHILYALFGRKQTLFGWAAFVGLMGMSFVWPGWIVWIVLTLVLLMVAHPHVPDGEGLGTKEKVIGWLCIVIFILTFIPVPVTFISP